MPTGPTQPGRLTPNANAAAKLAAAERKPTYGKPGLGVRGGGAAGVHGGAAKTVVYPSKGPGKKGSGIPTPSKKYNTFGAGAATTIANDAPVTGVTETTDANYDPSQLNLMDSTRIAGLAGSIQLPNASKYANAMSNLQYGGKINALTQRIKGLTNALPESLAALDKAFSNLDAQRVQQQQNFQTSGQGVANLFGNNTGAAAVAANQSAQASATAANQTGSLQDQNNAAATREADWKTRIQLLNNLAVNQTQSDLIGAQGERDYAKKGYYDQALKTRQDMVSQAISNQGALNNQRLSSALAAGQLEQSGQKTIGMKLQNDLTGLDVAARPQLLANTINLGKDNIVNQIVMRGISVAKANADLAQLKANNQKITTWKQAIDKGGDGTMKSMIIPQAAFVPDPTTGTYKLIGNPNTYFQKGVSQIMRALPNSKRSVVRGYVSDNIAQAIASTGGGWTLKNGRYVKVAK